MSTKLEMSNFGYSRGDRRIKLRALVHVALALGGLVWFLHLLFDYCKCQKSFLSFEIYRTNRLDSSPQIRIRQTSNNR